MRLALASLVSIVFAALIMDGALAQDTDGKPLIERATLWTIKPGMAAKFEAGLKKHNQFHAKQGDTQSHNTYVIESGEHTGHYWRTAEDRHWEDFDAEDKFADADAADSETTFSPYIAASRPMYFEIKVDVSNPRPDSAPAPMLWELNFLMIKPGHFNQMSLAMKRVKEAAQKVNWPEHWAWLVLVNGGEHDQFVLAIPHDSWASFNPPQKPFPMMLEEALGRADAESVYGMFDEAIASSRSEIVRFRPDLSYAPAKQ